MSITNRIKRLERLQNGETGFCICLGRIKYAVIFKRNAPGLVEKAPDVCAECGKPVNKNFIEVTFEQHLENVASRRAQAQAVMELFQD